jgi:hypothetical protein
VVVSHGQCKNGLRFGTQDGDQARSRVSVQPLYRHAEHCHGPRRACC